MKGAIEKAQEIVDQSPSDFIMRQQFENPANPGIYEKNTGPEIWVDTGGAIDILVCSVARGYYFWRCSLY